jgi:hypothetical protein
MLIILPLCTHTRQQAEECEPNMSEDGTHMSRLTTRLVDGGGDTEVLLSVTTGGGGRMCEGRR